MQTINQSSPIEQQKDKCHAKQSNIRDREVNASLEKIKLASPGQKQKQKQPEEQVVQETKQQ
jgi:hypothetical protein